MANTMRYTYMASPVGRLLLAGDDAGLRLLGFSEGRNVLEPEDGWKRAKEPFAEPVRQLEAYFARELTEFDFPLAPEGTTFQQAVWKGLLEIPYGETISYGELARRIGHPGAVRAVGAANGQNPIAIVVPCHRVIGSNGELTGYGGGLAIKETLLALERRQRPLF
jgi:methylated-DNA-[protein]-cysteine S-methyltransferase